MKYAEVAGNVTRLLDELPSQKTFIYELLLAYGSPKATVVHLKSGSLNLAKEPGEVLLKKKVWFKNVTQASRLSESAPQAAAARLPDPAKPSDNKQAERSLYVVIDKMPDGLRAAHHNLDLAVAHLYRCRNGTSK